MRATLLAACVAAALGKRAGNTLMPQAEEDRTASLMQFTSPAAEATKAASTSTALKAAATKAADTELFDAADCKRVMSPEGVCACCTPWTLAQISSLFSHGHPDNVLSSVGLTVHGFDGTLQGGGGPSVSLMTGAAYKNSGMLPWMPCDSGWCKNASRWLSTSVINAAHHPGLSDGGMILKPGATQVLCSHYRDFESLHDGCATDVNKHDGAAFHDQPFPPDDLKGMLQASLTYTQAYNEVLVDGKVYVDNLPHSVAAFYYGLLGSDDNWPRVHATQMYVAFLDFYKLGEDQLPLVQFDLGAADPLEQMTDTSAQARAFLASHPYSYALTKWQEAHADLIDEPEHVHEALRKEAEARRRAVAAAAAAAAAAAEEAAEAAEAAVG